MHPAFDVTNRNFFYKKLLKSIDFCKDLVYNGKQKGGVSMLQRLIDWEKANGYKGVFVARKLGLTNVQYSRLKMGRTKPTIEVLEKLHRLFRIPYEDAIKLLKEDK